MSIRIADLLEHVPPAVRPAPLNDARTIDALSVGIESRVVDWTLATAHIAVEETYRDIAPSRFEALAEDTARSIEAISLNLIRYLLGGRETAAAVRVSRAQRAVTIDAVHLGIPLNRIVGGLRALDHVWKTAFITLVLDVVPREDTADVLSRLDRALSTYFDALVDDNARSWAEENQRLADRRVLGQRQLIERIIAGHRVDDATVTDALGVVPADEHIGVVVSSAAQLEGPAVDFASFRSGVEATFTEHRVTFLPADGETVWLFLSGRPIKAPVVHARLASLREDSPSALISIGLPMRGTDGLRSTHLTANAAHALNVLTPAVGPVVSFADMGLLCILAQAPELAKWFVQYEVGPLLQRAPGSDELRRTLQTLLGNGGSLVRAAQELYVHRNTITYRLKKIEEALGRDPLERPVETRTALQLAELFGPSSPPSR